jgi:hypothetical protein
MAYSTGCDGHKQPAGELTAGVPRFKSNPSIPYGGAGIYECKVRTLISLYAASDFPRSPELLR